MTEQQEANFQKWMTALRSGEYEQGRRLYHERKTNCYCAVGVGLAASGYDFYDPARECVTSALEKLGIREDFRSEVYRLNDNEELPFPAIADEIEKHKSEWFESPVLAGT